MSLVATKSMLLKDQNFNWKHLKLGTSCCKNPISECIMQYIECNRGKCRRIEQTPHFEAYSGRKFYESRVEAIYSYNLYSYKL